MYALIAGASGVAMVVSLFTFFNLPAALLFGVIMLWACLADLPDRFYDNEKSTGAGDTDAK